MKRLIGLLLTVAAAAAVALAQINPAQIAFVSRFSNTPPNPSVNTPYLFIDASATGVCTGGGTSFAWCAWNGSVFLPVSAASSSNGPTYTTVCSYAALTTAISGGATNFFLPPGCTIILPATNYNLPNGITIVGQGPTSLIKTPDPTTGTQYANLGIGSVVQNVGVYDSWCYEQYPQNTPKTCAFGYEQNQNLSPFAPMQSFYSGVPFEVWVGDKDSGDAPGQVAISVIQTGNGGGIYGEFYDQTGNAGNGWINSKYGGGLQAYTYTNGPNGAALEVGRGMDGVGLLVLDADPVNSIGVAHPPQPSMIITGARQHGDLLSFFNGPASAAYDGNMIEALLGYGAGSSFTGNFERYESGTGGNVVYEVDHTGAVHTASGIINTSYAPGAGLFMFSPFWIFQDPSNSFANEMTLLNGKLRVYDVFQEPTKTFSALGVVPAAGVEIYCSDCVAQPTCAGSGTGAKAVSNGTNWTCGASGGGGSGTVTSVGLVGTANEISVAGTSPITASGSFTLSIPSPFIAPGAVEGTSFQGTDTTHTAYVLMSGKTSGGQGFSVPDVAGTATLYIMPTAVSSGGVLTDGGSTSCPTLAAGAPTNCELLQWGSASGGVSNTTVTVGTGTQGANSCSSTSTVTMTGLTTSMVVLPGYSATPTTYWAASGGMVFQIWPSASDTATWQVCNQTSSSITYPAITFNVGAR